MTTLLADQKLARHKYTVPYNLITCYSHEIQPGRRASHAMSSRPKNSSTWTSKRKTLQMQQILLSLVRESTNTISGLFISSTSLPHNLLLFMSSINSPTAVKHKRWIQTSAKSHQDSSTLYAMVEDSRKRNVPVSESCGPGEDSGWYWRDISFILEYWRPAQLLSLRLTWVTFAPSGSDSGSTA